MKELIEAYRNTRYVVIGTSIIIEIGKCSVDLEALLLLEGYTEWGFITAWNPYSKELNVAENRLRHEKLMAHVGQYKYFEGYGVGVDPSWVPEKSLLVLGIGREVAIAIGKAFEQNAIVTGKKGGEAELVMLNQHSGAIIKDQKNLSAFMHALNSGKSFDDMDEEMQSWWMNRY